MASVFGKAGDGQRIVGERLEELVARAQGLVLLVVVAAGAEVFVQPFPIRTVRRRGHPKHVKKVVPDNSWAHYNSRVFSSCNTVMVVQHKYPHRVSRLESHSSDSCGSFHRSQSTIDRSAKKCGPHSRVFSGPLGRHRATHGEVPQMRHSSSNKGT